MRRLLGRAVLACAVAVLALGPPTASRADEPAPTGSAAPTSTSSPSADPRQAEIDAVL